MAARDVLLASLPISSARYPSLALGLLKAAVMQAGITCDVRYFSLDYIDHVGPDTFHCLADETYYSALAGEWVFSSAAHDSAVNGLSDAGDIAGYLTDIFSPKCPKRELADRLIGILTARGGAVDFIERCVDSVDWDRYGVLGITSSFQQNMASLAFARRVKARHPGILIVFGGANCQGEMGQELHRCYPFIDAICLGEGDRTFPELIRRHLAGESIRGLPGFAVRDTDGATILPEQEVDQIEDLDLIPYPDFADFYQQRQRLPVASQRPAVVMFETARGCWWGAKHHCTFCGLNGRMMSYRSKSQPRAYNELRHLVSRHGNEVVNADAILDLQYFKDFIPRLADEGPAIRMFWQMKANIQPQQLAMLSRAGIKRIQPGIEALDTDLLKLMKKGCTMLQNVQVLKLAAECGLSVAWNLLYGFPGERQESYARSARLIPKLLHLQPPASTGRVLADRFSPYFQQSAAFGVRLAPFPAYRLIYPFKDESVWNLAYHFHMHSTELERIEEIVAPMRREQRRWRKHGPDSVLSCEDKGEAMVVTDARWGWTPTVRTYTGAEAAVLRLCWRIRSWNTIRDRLTCQFSDDELLRGIDAVLDAGVLLQENNEFIALALRQPGCRRAPTWSDIMAGRVRPYSLTDPLNDVGTTTEQGDNFIGIEPIAILKFAEDISF